MSKKDKRKKLWKKQRRSRGFDDRELWDLFHTISKFVAPRLRAFSKHQCGHPPTLTPEVWQDTIERMATAFEIIERDDLDEQIQRWEEVQYGLDLFRAYYMNLWD